MCEERATTFEAVQQQRDALVKAIQESGLSYAAPVLIENEIEKAVELRKAGLGTFRQYDRR